MLKINRIPGVYYKDTEYNSNNGLGAEIPVIIGKNNTPVEEITVQKYYTLKDALKPVSEGGIKGNNSDNPLLYFLTDFWQEDDAISDNEEETLGVPYVYVINMGTYDVTDIDKYLKAMKLAKTVKEASAEVYVGLTMPTESRVGNLTEGRDDFIKLMNNCANLIQQNNQYGNPRIGYFTIYREKQLNKIADLTGEETKGVYNSRICLSQFEDFGKIIARICNTPYYEEPGYRRVRSVKKGVYDHLTGEQKIELQNKGLIFLHDEKVDSEIITRINLTVASSFNSKKTRPADSFIHVRRNVDNLVRKIYDKLYMQIKRNETEMNISFLQTDVDAIIDAEINAGNMKEDTKAVIKVLESEPMRLVCEGQAHATGATMYIDFNMSVTNKKTTTGGSSILIVPTTVDYIVGTEASITVTAVDNNYEPYQHHPIRAIVNNEPPEILTTNNEGKALFELKPYSSKFKEEDNKIHWILDDFEDQTGTEAETIVNVSLHKTEILCKDYTFDIQEPNKIVEFGLFDTDLEVPVAGKEVKVLVGNNELKTTTDENGQASINLAPYVDYGDNQVFLKSEEDKKYQECINSFMVTVNNEYYVLSMPDTTFLSTDTSMPVTATFMNNKTEKPLKDKEILFITPNKLFKQKTNNKGEAIVDLYGYLEKGETEVIVKFLGDDEVPVLETKAKITIRNPVFHFNSDDNFFFHSTDKDMNVSVQLVDENEKPLPNALIKYTTPITKGSKLTDNAGFVNIDMKGLINEGENGVNFVYDGEFTESPCVKKIKVYIGKYHLGTELEINPLNPVGEDIPFKITSYRLISQKNDKKVIVPNIPYKKVLKGTRIEEKLQTDKNGIYKGVIKSTDIPNIGKHLFILEHAEDQDYEHEIINKEFFYAYPTSFDLNIDYDTEENHILNVKLNSTDKTESYPVKYGIINRKIDETHSIKEDLDENGSISYKLKDTSYKIGDVISFNFEGETQDPSKKDYYFPCSDEIKWDIKPLLPIKINLTDTPVMGEDIPFSIESKPDKTLYVSLVNCKNEPLKIITDKDGKYSGKYPMSSAVKTGENKFSIEFKGDEHYLARVKESSVFNLKYKTILGYDYVVTNDNMNIRLQYGKDKKPLLNAIVKLSEKISDSEVVNKTIIIKKEFETINLKELGFKRLHDLKLSFEGEFDEKGKIVQSTDYYNSEKIVKLVAESVIDARIDKDVLYADLKYRAYSGEVLPLHGQANLIREFGDRGKVVERATDCHYQLAFKDLREPPKKGTVIHLTFECEFEKSPGKTYKDEYLVPAKVDLTYK